MPRKAERLALLATSALLFVACRVEPRPEQVLRTYFQHLRKGRIAEAYALTSARHRAHRDLATFALAVARQSMLDEANLRPREPEFFVELTLSGERPVVLRGPRADLLRLDDDPLAFYETGTPELALRSFARAVRLQRNAQIVELLSGELREQFRPFNSEADSAVPVQLVEVARRISARLDPADGLPRGTLIESESLARVDLGGGATVSLAHTSSGWRLSDLP